MMRKSTFKTLIPVLVLLFALFVVLPARAHGGEPRLEISVERTNPGGVLEVRGVEFDYDEPIALSLMRAQLPIPLMDVTADGEGLFTQVVALPADLPPGEYNFQAQSDHHLVMSPTITVWGAGVQEQEDEAIREQSDVQFGAIPTLIATDSGVSSTPLPQIVTTEAPISRGISTPWMASILLGVGILVLLSLRILRKR